MLTCHVKSAYNQFNLANWAKRIPVRSNISANEMAPQSGNNTLGSLTVSEM